MAITIEQVKALLPFSRVGFTYTSANKMLVNATDGSGESSKVRFPMGVSKVAKVVVGVGDILRYSDMVKSAAHAQGVTDGDLADSFAAQPLKGYDWVDGFVGVLLRSQKSGTVQLRAYAIDDDGVIPSHGSVYIDNATGETLDYERDLKKFKSTAPSSFARSEPRYLVIGGVELKGADGAPIFMPAVKNYALDNISDLVVDP